MGKIEISIRPSTYPLSIFDLVYVDYKLFRARTVFHCLGSEPHSCFLNYSVITKRGKTTLEKNYIPTNWRGGMELFFNIGDVAIKRTIAQTEKKRITELLSQKQSWLKVF